jgi:hypothetical protein
VEGFSRARSLLQLRGVATHLPKGEHITAAEFELLDESAAESLICWRFEELMESGYELGDALRLAVATHVDVHRAADLLRRGCPVETAMRILL